MRIFEIETLDAPNSQNINKNKAFDAWFGNSKIRDKNGNPLQVYHGTNSDADFMEFTPVRSGSPDVGYYFTRDSEYASGYATAFSNNLNNARIVPAYLSIQNPYFCILKPNGINGFDDTAKTKLIKQGYDGLVVGLTEYEYETGSRSIQDDASEIVAFKPNQIKSIFNSGSWKQDTKNISETSAISEAKNVGILYHFTDLHSAWAILEDKQLKIGDTEGSFLASGGGFTVTHPRTHISLTRNPRLQRLGENYPWGPVRIVLDGDKLSQKYKINPYQDQIHGITRHENQAEEMIANHVVDITGCVVRVDFNISEYITRSNDFETWVSMPDDDSKKKYIQLSKDDAQMFVKYIKSLGYDINVVKKF